MFVQFELRNPPPGQPHVKPGSEGWRPIVSYGIGAGQLGPLVVPETYTVKLTVDGTEHIQEITVKKDPITPGSEADIRSQVKLSLEILDDINSLARMINQIEWIRKQLTNLTAVLKEQEDAAPIMASVEELDERLIHVEKNLFQMELTGAGQDIFRAPAKLYSRYCTLAGAVAGAADIGYGYDDYPPTTQQVEVHEVLKERLTAHKAQLGELLNQDLPAFNNLLKENNLANIIVPESP